MPVNNIISIHQRVAAIRRELETTSSPAKIHQLTHELDATLRVLLAFRRESAANPFIQADTEALSAELKTLYGRVATAWVKGEVAEIQGEAQELQAALLDGNIEAEKVRHLARHLKAFRRECRPAIPERRVLAEADETLRRAKAQLSGEVQNHFAWLAEQKPALDLPEAMGNDLGDVEELFDIAGAIYNGKLREAKMHYNQLPSDHKRRFEQAMQQLTAKPFIDLFETMQGLIATANAVVGNGEGVPSRAEIDELFLGLAQVLDAEESSPASKIISFRADVPPESSLGG